MENKLLPCPFCGKTETAIWELEGFEPFNCCVFCDRTEGGCGAAGGFGETEDEAIEAWNRRANNETNKCR